MHKIAVVGTGYVGLVTGACLSDFGLEVICVDNNAEKINQLKEGIIPIYEPSLNFIVERNVYYKRLAFTTDIKFAVENADVIFIAVGTPPAEDGSADLKYVYEVASNIASYINGYKVIVNKSTVPVGTGKAVEDFIQDRLKERNVDFEFDVVSNPEFLREGSAIYDFTHPDRIVIGSRSKKAVDIMKNVYRVLYLNETPFVETGVETAEIIKYASNAFLAMKITFINEIASLCEKIGANVQDVSKAMGRDGRIGPKFLNPGPGYGGSCFPKDTRALAETGKKYGSNISLVEATILANERHKLLMVEKVCNYFGELENKVLAILGLAFKQNTDDMRDSASITIIKGLAEAGASFKVYDPAAMDEARLVFKGIEDKITYCHDEYDTVSGADALIIITEWNQFRNLDLGRIKSSLKSPVFFDYRNIYRRSFMEEKGFIYMGVGQ
ncbi:UDP-glucose dehydrogenase [Anaerobacterium chartisolvens]|uniref:UDP-glucose 6-dehydrogenase n=1 Tax=Anaerobacterium chartisolvens TaxID=1297424 RepID=A0A369AID1_9FIRM|nr:UDP-glucose/GDP-mannose dehydrogenase family protein [Anaerobacterium chartisolvens]RCX09110.1 UDP-glucose dehydrogenase [Anaerobacterium chartisolvens]